MAPVGQGAIQAPQPVHFCSSISGQPMAAGVANRMAPTSHCSGQTRQITPCTDMQASDTSMWKSQGCRGELSSLTIGPSASVAQASTQAPQKVHSPAVKSISGKPPAPKTMICSSQASEQAPVRSQKLTNRDSERAHGGRIGKDRLSIRPRNRSALEI